MGLVDELIASLDWKRSFHAGFHDTLQVAERVRLELGIGRGPIEGDSACRYLLEVLSRLERRAEVEAARGYGRYRWLWYLRALPDVIFEGELESICPYNRGLAEILATRGAGPERAIGGPADDGSFPLDGTAAKRIAWTCGFTWGVALSETHFRIIGKGGKLVFDQRRPGVAFPVSRIVDDELLMRQLRVFDERNDARRLFTKLGVPVDEYFPDEPQGTSHLFLVEKFKNLPPVVMSSDRDSPLAALMRFRPNLMPIDQIVAMLSHPSVQGMVSWSPEIPDLIALLSLASLLFVRDPLSRLDLFQTGTMFVEREDFDILFVESRDTLAELKTMLDLFPEARSHVRLSERLLEIEGSSTPYRPGPVAFLASGGSLGIDPYNATQRLITLLEFPEVGGDAVNVKGFAFEARVQEIIDDSPWAPPDYVRPLIGRHSSTKGSGLARLTPSARVVERFCLYLARVLSTRPNMIEASTPRSGTCKPG